MHFHSGAEVDRGRLVLSPEKWPTAAQRELLESRHKQLVAHLGQHDRSIIGAAVIELLGCYRNALKPGEDAQAVAAKYVKEMAGLPTWACLRACTSVRLNHAEGFSMDYPPSTIKLRDYAASYCAVAMRETSDIFAVLHAARGPSKVSDDERERVGEKLKGLAEQLRANVAGGTDTLDRHHLDAKLAATRSHNESLKLREYAARGLEPVYTGSGDVVSLELAQRVGVRVKARESEGA